MNTFEIITNHRTDGEKTVHVLAPDEGHAIIEFRKEYCLDEWTVRALNELNEPQVIEHPV